MAAGISIGGLMFGAILCYAIVQKLRRGRRPARNETGSADGGSGDASWGGADQSTSAGSCGFGDSGGCDGGGDGGGGGD